MICVVFISISPLNEPAIALAAPSVSQTTAKVGGGRGSLASLTAASPGARLILAYLGVFMAIGLLFPAWFIDLSYFLLAAGLVLPLLMVEVVRLGRNDQAREVALTRAAARPNCRTIALSRGVQRVLLDESRPSSGPTTMSNCN